jgi:hypothetical protein
MNFNLRVQLNLSHANSITANSIAPLSVIASLFAMTTVGMDRFLPRLSQASVARTNPKESSWAGFHNRSRCSMNQARRSADVASALSFIA